MPITPQEPFDDAQEIKEDAKRLVHDLTEPVENQVGYAEDEVLAFTHRKPLVALLTALLIGVILGKLAP